MRFEQRSIPTADEVRQKHVFWLAEQVHQVTEINPAIQTLLPAVTPLISGLSPEAVLARVLQLRLSGLMEAYEDAGDLNPATNLSREAREAAFGERQRIMIRVGRLDRLKEGAVVRLTCERAGIKATDIGAIDIKREFAFFDVRAEYGRRVLSALSGAEFDGRPLEPKFVDPSEDLHGRKGGKTAHKPFSKGKKPFVTKRRNGKPPRKSGASDNKPSRKKGKTE